MELHITLEFRVGRDSCNRNKIQLITIQSRQVVLNVNSALCQCTPTTTDLPRSCECPSPEIHITGCYVPSDLVGPGSSGLGTDKDGWLDEVEENESYINKKLLGRSYIAGVEH